MEKIATNEESEDDVWDSDSNSCDSSDNDEISTDNSNFTTSRSHSTCSTAICPQESHFFSLDNNLPSGEYEFVVSNESVADISGVSFLRKYR